MSTVEEKTNSASDNKIDIEAIRHHLLNYRSKADDSDADMTMQMDLDSSFKRMLEEKKQMTNKENNPPPIDLTASINPPEKPLRKDLLKDRMRWRMQDDSFMEQSSYILEHSIGTDLEFSTINRLLAYFNINPDSSGSSRRSPLKNLKITSDFLDEAGPSSQPTRFDALDRTVDANHSKIQAFTEAVNPDDTLEEMEYVLDRGLNYVPKRLINEIKSNITYEFNENNDKSTKEIDENGENQENNEDQEDSENIIPSIKFERKTSFLHQKIISLDDSDDVILIESSPENSFTTTQGTDRYKSALESVEGTFYTARPDENESVVSLESDTGSDDKFAAAKPNKYELKDLPTDESLELSSSTQRSHSNASETYGEMPHFNDTLERVEYMMEQGQKMMAAKNKLEVLTATKANTPTSILKVKTPVSQAKARTPAKHRTPGGSAKKPVMKALTPNQFEFKRPEARNRSPFVGKSASKLAPKTQGPAQSRIPMKTASLQKPQFRHIASPIAAYIKNTPEFPLMKTVKPARNLLTQDFTKVFAPKHLDESTLSVESFPKKAALPFKMYTSAPERKIIDRRQIVTPGGASVKNLIGSIPLIIRHEGKVKSYNHQPRQQERHIDDSLADLSVASGDVSLQVVQDVNRK